MGVVQFEDLYRCELRTLIALGTSLTGSREAGADLAHEAMLRAYRSWSTVGSLDRPGAWIRTFSVRPGTDTDRRVGVPVNLGASVSWGDLGAESPRSETVRTQIDDRDCARPDRL